MINKGMFREIVTSSVTLANSGIVVGDNGAPAVSGLTVYGDVSATGKIYAAQVFVNSSIIGGGTGSLPNPTSLGDVLKTTDIAGVTAWTSSRVNVEELGSIQTPTEGAVVTFDANSNKFIAKIPEETVSFESSYIKKLANCNQCRKLADDSKLGYAAITNDNRVIAWGWIPSNPEGFILNTKNTTTPTFASTENVRIPFWNYYDGYSLSANYKPYGGDFFDDVANKNKSLPKNQQKNYIISDLYWSRQAAMCLVSASDEDGGDVWVAGTNSYGTPVGSNANPNALVKTKFGSYLIANETGAAADTAAGGIYFLNPGRDICAIQKYAAGASRDIIEDKTNSPDLSADSYYWVCDANSVRRINHFGESVFLSAGFTTPMGLTMVTNTSAAPGTTGKNLLYIGEPTKIKVVDITNIATVSSMPLVATIGTGIPWTATPIDGTITAQFKSIKKIDSDPKNPHILYVTDGYVVRRIWRKADGGYKVDTITGGEGNIQGTVLFTSSSPGTKFKVPNGIKVNSLGNKIFVADQFNKNLVRIDIDVNEEANFTGNASLHVNTTYKTPALFKTTKGIAKDSENNIYIADELNHVIRKISYNNVTKQYGDVTTIGLTGGNVVAAGTFSTAKFKNPRGITYSLYDNSLYVTNFLGHQISKISLVPGSEDVSIVAGSTTAGFRDSTSTNAQFNGPNDICYANFGVQHYLYVSDYNNQCIRKIDIGITGYGVTTVVGQGTKKATNVQEGAGPNILLQSPAGLYYEAQNLYFTHFHCVQKYDLTNSYVTTIAGTSAAADATGNSSTARFNTPIGISVSGNDMYVVDSKNLKIKKIANYAASNRLISQAAGSTLGDKIGPANTAQFNSLNFLFKNDDDILITDNNYVKSLYTSGGNLYVKTINGTSVASYQDTSTKTLDISCTGLFLDKSDNLSFVDISTDNVSEVTTNGFIDNIRRMTAGSLGIGEGTNKTTNGFIKVKPLDYFGKIPKFKRIQFLGDAANAVLFAALDTEDSLWIWGNSVDGAFGTGQYNTAGPTKIYQFEKNVKDFQITASNTGVSLISIITKDNKLFSAGDNTNFQLGRGSTVITSSPEFKIFKQCKKDSSNFVSDAEKLIVSNGIGTTNNLYISTLKEVWACGFHTQGILGNGPTPLPANSKQEYFKQIAGLNNVIYLLGATSVNNVNNIVFALKDNGELWSWGYNGATSGQTLTNNLISQVIFNPAQTYNYDLKDNVRNAKYVFCNDNPLINQIMVAYIDNFDDLYVGGYSTGADIPDMAVNIPYFSKFNMRNIQPDVILTGKDAVVRRSNGTVYKIDDYGAKKMF